MSKIRATGMMDPRLIDFLDGSSGRIENRPQLSLETAKHSERNLVSFFCQKDQDHFE